MSASSFRDRVNAHCAGLPGAERSDPWGGGHDAWKVGGKMFACIGAINPGVSVKCADTETAQMLIESGVAQRPKYFHASWVHLPETCDPDELAHRLDSAYRIIRSKLPKRVQAAIGPFPG
ncbi:MAG: MmcQ/YjbR family DNA-binding protein [Rhodobacteraceae bacterium]|nr:MmcQ/YjbR family DNA-binding protein [Paracoccaceae bacterium]